MAVTQPCTNHPDRDGLWRGAFEDQLCQECYATEMLIVDESWDGGDE